MALDIPDSLNMNGRTIDGLLDPVGPQQAATRIWVETAIQALTNYVPPADQVPVLQTVGLPQFIRDTVGDYLKQGDGISIVESADASSLSIGAASASTTIIYGGNATTLGS